MGDPINNSDLTGLSALGDAANNIADAYTAIGGALVGLPGVIVGVGNIVLEKITDIPDPTSFVIYLVDQTFVWAMSELNSVWDSIWDSLPSDEDPSDKPCP